tara:strand:- start:727 stop:1437 length:711 start_codon:yes stop_codon:yes gene_type:complete
MSKDSDVAQAKFVPAPWLLTGACYSCLVKLPQSFGRQEMFLADGMADRRGGFAMVMFVRYDSSSAGPYDELLFLPMHSFPFGAVKGRTISKIYVSSRVSVDSGRKNWGIPKELADFEIEENSTRLAVTVIKPEGADVIGRLEFIKARRHMPCSLNFVPKRLRTLYQSLDGKIFSYTPQATGRLGWAGIHDCWFDEELFPPIKASYVKSVLSYQDFQMRFPESHQVQGSSAVAQLAN